MEQESMSISSGTTIAEESSNRAPSTASVDSFLNHLAVPENQSMVDLQLKAMHTWNADILAKLKPDKGKSMTSDTIRLIFFLCEELRVTTDLARYHAVEIFDRFMIAFNAEVVNATRNYSEERRKEYQKHLLEKQVLSIVMCIQLASKTVGLVAAVTSTRVQSILHKMGFKVDNERILLSELKVMKVVDYNLNVLTPLEVLECVLMLMGMEKSEYRKIYSLCVTIIDFVYISKFDIYQCFRRKTAREKPHVFRTTDFHRKENDYFLLAGAIAQCAMIIHYSNAIEFNRKLPMLGRLTGVDVQEIASLSHCIAYFIFKCPV